jgi:DNA-binding CsgD family transcriptional regulator
MELAFAGLHQLCAPFLDRLDRIPTPQAEALGTAFGLRVGDPPDRFLVGLAVLSLLSDVGETQPLVCLVDDAQWLDQASAQTLGFVARRLAAEAVVMIFAMRQPWDDRHLAGVPDVIVAPLPDPDARELLVSVIPGRLDVSVRERIVAEARGNPLALLELPKAWTPAAFAGGFGLPDTASVSGRIEESFRRRMSPLPDPSRRLMLIAAAEPVGDHVLIWAAAERLGITVDAAEAVTAAGLLDAGTQLRFRHPLVRSVVYRDSPIADRRLVHAALAEATDPALDPDRRAWHLAAAASGPDEVVADELERSAGRAQARGGVAAAAAFLQRAVALTDDPGRQGERALAAAQASIQAGSFDVARALLLTAEGRATEEFQRALVDLMRAHLAFASSRGNEATPLLLAAARRLESLNLKLARETYLDAFSAALFGARLNDGVGVPEVAAAARASARPPSGDATAADLLLDTLVALSDDYATAIGHGRNALSKLSSEGVSPQERLRWLWQGCVIALELWDDESAANLSDRSVKAARESGTLSELALALSAYTPVVVFCGDFATAISSLAETHSVEAATGVRSAPYGALMLAAWRGDARTARELIEATIRDAGARGEGIGLAVAEYARAVLSNGLGRYDEALEAARSASEYREVVVENWGLSELIEPATRTGRIDLATEALDRLSVKAAATGTAWALGIEARSRALLSEGDMADDLFRRAIEHLSRTRVRIELARARLLYGEWLRREGRRVDAREQLRMAHDVFVATGIDAFAERARAELLATGERVRARTFETRDDLTPQELQIARLASDGLSNPEIGSQLFLSPRTVEWHLRKVFSKLGITTRRELRKALPSTQGPPHQRVARESAMGGG